MCIYIKVNSAKHFNMVINLNKHGSKLLHKLHFMMCTLYYFVSGYYKENCMNSDFVIYKLNMQNTCLTWFFLFLAVGMFIWGWPVFCKINVLVLESVLLYLSAFKDIVQLKLNCYLFSPVSVSNNFLLHLVNLLIGLLPNLTAKIKMFTSN